MSARRGFTVCEVAVAAAILTTLAVVCAQMLAASAQQNRMLQDRRAAMNEAANVMERLFVQSWDQLTPEAAARATLGDEFRQALPGGRLSVEVNIAANPPRAKQIVVRIEWMDAPGRPPYSVRLSAWKYRTDATADASTPESEDGP